MSENQLLLEKDRGAVETRLAELVGARASHHERMAAAIRYSLLGGGKRLRPILCLWTFDALGSLDADRRDAVLDAACAVECVHTYSLVHDDLPCMDDDDLRRGKPSAHVKFGEATAVLTGDALQSLAFEIIATIADRHGGRYSSESLSALAVLASASGTGGLITGQALDLEPETGSTQDPESVLDLIQANKTGRLIAAAMEIGAVFGGAGDAERQSMRRAGMSVGRAFQIVDDILDVTTDKETLGKTPGKDIKDGKLTYNSIWGNEQAAERARELLGEALSLLGPPADGTDRLRELLRLLVERRA